jgi:hypothetical protein
MKISSRAGRFKKKLVSHETLKLEAPAIEAGLAPLLTLYRQKSITEAELCSLYVILYLSTRYPKAWLGAKRPSLAITHEMNFPVKNIPFKFEGNIEKRLPETLGDIFNSFALKSTPETVNRSLLSWSTGSYPLILLFHIPRPEEVLEQQKMGKRCVTLLTKDLHKFVLGERDPLSFTMHDLIHADHFYYHNECFEGQLSLYWFLDFCMKAGHFDELMENEDFKWELEYLISDMNAYAVHSLKCLKAALIFYHPEKESFFESWVKKTRMPGLLKLSTPRYVPENEDHIMLEQLKSYRSAT